MDGYSIDEEPTFVAEGEGPLPGHYQARFRTGDGERLTRYLTDKGRAEVLRLMERRKTLTRAELEEHTVEPDIDALARRMDEEGGEGA